MFSRLATGTCSHHRPSAPRHGTVIRCDAQKPAGRTQSATDKGLAGLGDVLGPIGLTIGKVDTKVLWHASCACPLVNHCLPQVASTQQDADSGGRPTIERLVESAGVSMGPIALTFGSDTRNGSDAPSTSGRCFSSAHVRGSLFSPLTEQAGVPGLRSIASMSTEEWRAAYERDGHVDLWVEEEFNSGSRLVVCMHSRRPIEGVHRVAHREGDQCTMGGRMGFIRGRGRLWGRSQPTPSRYSTITQTKWWKWRFLRTGACHKGEQTACFVDCVNVMLLFD